MEPWVAWSILTVLSHANFTEGLVSYSPPDVSFTTNIVEKETVNIIKDVVEISHHIPFDQLEASLDSLQLRLANLQFASQVDHYDPISMAENPTNVLIFRKYASRAVLTVLCESLGLPTLNLQNLPKTLKVRNNIRLQVELTVSSTATSCVGPNLYKKDEECFLYIFKYNKFRSFYKSYKEMREDLLRQYPNTKLHLKANTTHVFFSPASDGVAGCLGDRPEESTLDSQVIYDQYNLRLNAIFSTLFSNIEKDMYRLIDAIYILTPDQFKLAPVGDNRNIIAQIAKLSPRYLPEVLDRQYGFRRFEEFFRKTSTAVFDAEIAKLKDTEFVTKFDQRIQLRILSAVTMFEHGLTSRMKNLVSHLNPSLKATIPLSVLYRGNQSAASFIQYALSFSPEVDDELLAEYYIVISNEKACLIQRLAEALAFSASPPFLTRSDFSSILAEPEVWKDDLATDLIRQKAALKNDRNGTVPRSLARVKYSTRRKRGAWGDFWGGFFGVASESKLAAVMDNELKIDMNAIDLSRVVANLTSTNHELLGNIKQFTGSVSSLTDRQDRMFHDLEKAMGTEHTAVKQMRVMIQEQDKAVILTAEYQAIALQANFLIEAANKIRRLVASSLTNTVDLSLLPAAQLRQVTSSNMKLSLQRAKTTFKYTLAGHTLVWSIPSFLEPFKVFKFQEVPFFKNGEWYGQKNVPGEIVLNFAQDELDLAEVERYCTLLEGSYTCERGMVNIRRNVAKNCRHQLIARHLAGTGELSYCKPTKIYAGYLQSSIVKGDTLLLANPHKPDSLTSICAGSAPKVEPLPIGLVTFKLMPNCNYHTSEINIPAARVGPKLDDSSDNYSELLLVQMVMDSEEILDQGNLRNMSDPEIQTLLDRYSQDLQAAGKPVSEIMQQLQRITSLNSLSDFNPVHLDLTNINSATNWMVILFWCIVALSFVIGLIVIWFKHPYLSELLYLACCFCRVKNFRSRWAVLRMRMQGDKSRPMEDYSRELQAVRMADILRSPSPDFKVSAPVAPKRTPASENLEPLLPIYTSTGRSADGKLQASWTIITSELGQLVLTTDVVVNGRSIKVIYDEDADAIIGENGECITSIHTPSESLKAALQVQVQCMKLPDMVRTPAGKLALRIDPTVQFKPGVGWFDMISMKRVPGLRAPSSKDIELVPDRPVNFGIKTANG